MDEIHSFLERLETVRQKHPEYKREAYHFVMISLHYTVSKLKDPRHVSGKELCFGIRDYALEQYGSMAMTVLEYWGLRETKDFGKIVFYLIEEGLMAKTDEDSIDDFKEVYSFDGTFNQKIEYDI